MGRKVEVYRRSNSYVATVGGGVSTEEILQILRVLYLGGVKWDERIPQVIASGDGPCRFFQCFREYLTPEHAQASSRDVLCRLQEEMDGVTYEVGLRWFITNPGEHMLGEGRGRRRIAVLPPSPIEINGKPQAILFVAGGDGPLVYLVDVDLDKRFPPDWDFISAREVRANPYCS